MAGTNRTHVHNRKMPENRSLFVLFLTGVELDTAWLNHSPYLCSRKPCSHSSKDIRQATCKRTYETNQPPTQPTLSVFRRFRQRQPGTSRGEFCWSAPAPRPRVQPELLHTKTAQSVWRPTNKSNKKCGQNFFESNLLYRLLKFASSLMTAKNCHTDTKMSSKKIRHDYA